MARNIYANTSRSHAPCAVFILLLFCSPLISSLAQIGNTKRRDGRMPVTVMSMCDGTFDDVKALAFEIALIFRI